MAERAVIQIMEFMAGRVAIRGGIVPEEEVVVQVVQERMLYMIMPTDRS